jgi:hypothetical protein
MQVDISAGNAPQDQDDIIKLSDFAGSSIDGHETGLFRARRVAQNLALMGSSVRTQLMLRAAQAGIACTATAQGSLFIAQVAVTCAQVSKWKWNLERSGFGSEYCGIFHELLCISAVSTPDNDATLSDFI